VRQPLSAFELWVPLPCACSSVLVFLSSIRFSRWPIPIRPFFALCGAHERKIRTLHETREEYGTQSWANRPHGEINLAATFLRRKQEKRTICEPDV
jgi:hypothetical protein